MKTVLATILLASMAFGHSAPQETGSETVASFTFAGRLVSVKTPPPVLRETEGAYISFEGWNYSVTKGGRVLGRWKESNFWTETLARYKEVRPKIAASTKPWRTRIVIFTRADVLRQRDTGVHQERIGLETRGLNDVFQQIGLFKMRADVAFNGGRELQVQVDLENEPIRLDERKGEKLDAWLQSYLMPRSNAAAFDEDSAKSGPFDSVIVIHPLSDPPSGPGLNWISERSFQEYRPISYYEAAGFPTGVALQLERQLQADLIAAYQRIGFDLPNSYGLESLAGNPLAATLDLHGIPNRANYVAHRQGEREVAGYSHEFEPAYAAFASSLLPADVPKKLYPSGILRAEIGELNVLKRLGWEGKTIGDFPVTESFGLALRQPRTSPNVTVTEASGKFTYSEEGGARFGYGEIFRGTPSGSFVTLKARSQSRDPLAIRAISTKQSAEFRLYGLGPEWKTFTFRLPSDTVALAVAAPQSRKDRLTLGPIVAEFEGLTFADEGVVTDSGPSLTPNLQGTAEERVLFAMANPPSMELLRDSDANVQLNALLKLIEKPDPAMKDVLMTLGRSVNSWVAELAIEALAAIGDAPSRVALGDLALTAPLDLNRALAASKLEPGVGSSSQISQLFASKSWQARQMAARALGRYRTAQDQTILMAFLLDPDPSVRAAVVAVGDIQNEVVSRRLEWTSVNDPSEMVRGLALSRLLESSDARLQRAGEQGIRDESPAVRYAMVKAVEKAKRRGPLLVAVTDEDPTVKALALKALASFSNPITPEEVATVFNDPMPQVQWAIMDLVKAGRLQVPLAGQASLKASVDPEIAREAKARFGE